RPGRQARSPRRPASRPALQLHVAAADQPLGDVDVAGRVDGEAVRAVEPLWHEVGAPRAAPLVERVREAGPVDDAGGPAEGSDQGGGGGGGPPASRRGTRRRPAGRRRLPSW